MPTEKELIDFAVEEEFLLFCDEEEFLQIAEAVLQRFAPVNHEAAQLQARVAELEGVLREAADEAFDDNNVVAESRLWELLGKWSSHA